jgi:hypothetical protein
LLDIVLAGIAASPVAAFLKTSQIVYPIVNATHILGLATLFGAILVLDLRLLGAFPTVPARPLAYVLPRIASCGLAVAVVTGSLLFSVEPYDYAGNRAFLTKVMLVLIGASHAIYVHSSRGWRSLARGGAGVGRGLKISAAVSLLVWIAAIFAGRFIAF